MWNMKKVTWKSWSLLGSMTHRQYFSILYMNGKQFDPTVFDVLIRDIDEKDLHEKISKALNKPYLQPLQDNQQEFQEIRTGIIYGEAGRGFLSLPTRNKEEKPIWIHYLINPGSPFSYLTESALKVLKVNPTQNMFQVKINGSPCPVKLSSHHFEQINLLGMNFLLGKKSLFYDIKQVKIVLTDYKEA